MSQTYSKTTLGMHEVASRSLNLSFGLRNALILVDKSRSIDKLERDAKRIGSPDDFIAQLLALGLIIANENTNDTGNGSDATSTEDRSKTVTIPTKSIPNIPGAPTAPFVPFDLRSAQRQLVKLIEKTLGPGGERFALAVESTESKDTFIAEAKKIKSVLSNVRADSAQASLWVEFGI